MSDRSAARNAADHRDICCARTRRGLGVTHCALVIAMTIGMAPAAIHAQTAQDDEESLDFLFGDEPADRQEPEDTPPGEGEPEAESAQQSDDPSPAEENTPEPYDDVITVDERSPAVPAQEAGRPRPQIEEVIVTAQRREENIQDVAISITVFDQKQIADANITTGVDLANYTPSLSANTRFGPDNASFAIRGFTQDLRTTASVATYFAEVVAPRGQSSQTSGDGAGPGALFDLENVQVLKGPQGTLFGRNTTGGAVLLVPQKPTDEFEGYLEANGGNLGERRVQGVVNYPLTDNFKIRFGVDDKQRDGNLNNVLNFGADDLGNINYTAARLSLLWDVTDRLENYTILTFTDSQTNGYSSSLFACNEELLPSDVGSVLGTITDLLTGNLDLASTANPFALFVVQPCQQQLEEQRANGNDGYYDLYSSVADPKTNIREKRLINTTTWQISDSLTFKNIFAYAHLFTENESSIFGTFFQDPTNPNGRREFSVGASVQNPTAPVTSQETFIEEIQFQGTGFNDRLIWQAGIYYENSQPDGFSGNNAASFLYCDLGTISGPASGYDCFDPLGGILGGVLKQDYKTEYLNQAVYAQGTYDFTSWLSTTIGLRYTKDETEAYGIKTLHRYLGTVQRQPAVTITTPSVTSEAPTGLIELNVRPWSDIMFYGKYIRGYRQGNVIPAADEGLDSFTEETVDTYEIGAKTSFGGPVPGRFNFAVFHNDLTNQQLQGGYISTTSGPTTTIFNAGESRIRGFEVEAFLQPFQFMTASLSYSYLDTKLLEQEDRSDEVAQVGFFEGFTYTPIAVEGDELPFAADHSYAASLNFFLPIPQRWGRMNFGTTYAYTGEMRAAATGQTPFDILDDFALLNFNLAWTDILGRPLEFTAFATNVLDEQYATYVSGTYSALGIETRSVGLPRTIGARLRWNF